METLNIYTGALNYKNIEFTFVFDGDELRLISSPEEKRDVHNGHLEKSVPMIYFCDSTAKKNEIGAANRIPDADFMYLSGLEAPKLRVFPAKGYSYPTVISFRRKTE